MSRNSRATCVALPTAVNVAENSGKVLTKDERNREVVKQRKKPLAIAKSAKPYAVPQKRRRSLTKTNAFRDLRVRQEYLSGKNQTQIAKEIGINRDTVNKIVRAPEMSSYIEAKLEEWCGLYDPALEVLRQKLKEGDKEVALRVLESTGVIPSRGATLNHNIQTAAKPTGDERVKELMAAFAGVAIERARVFKTPFPEIAEVADKIGVKLDFELNGSHELDEEENDI